MGFINLADKTISAKLVYYGVGMGGKTTSLQCVHRMVCPKDEVQLVSIQTEDESTLLFDFLPIELGEVGGFKIRIQGFTVPGQPKYRRMRRYVLRGADAVVLVVDSQRSRLDENLQSLASLQENLRANGLDPERLPILLQYNKRDLDDILPEAELDQHFKWRDGIESFPTVAHEGAGVFEAFVHAAEVLVSTKVRLYGLARGDAVPERVAEDARRRLWEVRDRHHRTEVPSPGPCVSVTVHEPEPIAATSAPLSLDISDADLEQPIQTVAVLASEANLWRGVEDDDHEEVKKQLEGVIAANVELAQRFGELDRYKTLLERQNRELIRVTENTVHDLNRPVTAVHMMLSSMRSGLFGELPNKMRDAVETSLLAAKQMERLIRDLTDVAQLNADGVQLRFESVDMTLLLAEVLHGMRPEIEMRAAVVCVESLPVILADAWALHKAFTNLVGNALQYAHQDRRPRIRIGVDREDDRQRFWIADNGIGIPECDFGRLFRRFERGSNTKGISGTGLGLHIVREVVRGHGGEVWSESREDEGTTFFVAIPHQPCMPPRSMVED